MKVTIYAASLSILLLSIPKLAIAQGRSTTNPDGSTTTVAPSNEYGKGGSEETTSDKNFKVTDRAYYDKCGRIRQRDLPHGHAYWSPDGSGRILEAPGDSGKTVYQHYSHVTGKLSMLHPDYAKELIEEWQKDAIPPCDTTDVAPGPPEKPKDHPNPLGKVLENVSIGIGVSGGHTVGRDDHGHDRHLSDRKHATSSTTKKTVTAGCKCHPCTCSPCRCH
jgi:hypothetical protein